jgi:hypothetical protein
MSYHPLGSMLRPTLGLMDVLLRFGFSGLATWIRPLDLISDGSDGTILLWLLLNTFLGETSVLNGFVWSVAISTPSSLFLVSGFENSDLARFNSLFSAKFWLRIPIDDEISIHLFCHSLGSRLRLLLRLVKVVLEYGFRDTLLGTIRLAGLGMDLMVLFFFCDFFWGLGVLKRPETIVVWRHWFGRSLRPGKPSNSPRCVEGATMARRAPFPLSSIPAYIEQSMKLFVWWTGKRKCRTTIWDTRWWHDWIYAQHQHYAFSRRDHPD